MPRPTSTPSSTSAHTINMATSSPSTPNPAPPAGIPATTRPRSDNIDPSAYIAPSVGLPTTVSPSSLGDFKTCPRLYRFRHLEKIQEPPSEVMVRGSMVHDALDELFSQPPEKRSKEVLHDIFRAVWLKRRDKYLELFPSTEDQRAFGMAGLKLLSNYLKVETPAEQEPLMREFRMRVPFPDGPSVTGILDRVDLEPGSGEWVVVDYKTGKAPALKYSDAVNERIMNDKFFQLKVYALLLEQVKQRTPTRLKLIYLDGPTVMSMRLRREDLAETKTELLGLWERIVGAWKADSFPATPGKLCEWCSFKSICPAWNFTREEGGEVEGMKSVGGVEGDAWVAGRDAKGGVAQG
ncbi:hypothetical protein NSK_005079 [Nannochloropsis salina CCMP1776]|uniref:PD-(D/E)XK endonuclease-like domain-containing protein n=1 Tax=Nannochloropsis salina CCMP1776 TaxID=1027361 RepID=A0A4D9CZI2_9STRA|nr:hypothetical protein NSK_005079 [Nannochloropsis salina CCMP1776]|eukprot:TFJ83984.1 hypothetical protein NSK_005079 [Nannochloropsis salina CCMP1776]